MRGLRLLVLLPAVAGLSSSTTRGPGIGFEISSNQPRAVDRRWALSSAAATIVASPFAAHAAGVSSLKGSLDEQGRKAAAARRTKLAMDAAASGAPTQAAEASAASAARRQDLASERDVIKVLYAYLEEMERDIFARKWGTLMEYVKVFTQQEAAFAALVESSFGTAEAYDRDATAALEFEAGRIFLALDDMADAAAYRNVARAEQAYAALAIAYDRFLKVPVTVPITGGGHTGRRPSTRSLFFCCAPALASSLAR